MYDNTFLFLTSLHLRRTNPPLVTSSRIRVYLHDALVIWRELR